MAFPVGAVLGMATGLLGGNNPNPPKTKVGKFLGNFTGRNAKTSNPANPVQSIPLNPNTQGISGSLSFGQNQRLNYANFAVLAAIVAVVYFLFGDKKRRRR